MSARLEDRIEDNKAIVDKLPELVSSLEKSYEKVSISLKLDEQWSCSRVGDETTVSRPITTTGAVIRIFKDCEVKEFGTSSLNELEDIISALRKEGNVKKGQPKEITDIKTFSYPFQTSASDVSRNEKLALLSRTAQLVKNDKVSLTKLHFKQEDSLHVFVGNGRHYTQRIPFSTLSLAIFVKANGRTESQKTGARLPGGFEVVDKLITSDIVDKTIKQALDLTRVEKLEAGMYDIVAAPEPASVIAHEAFGHGVEADMALCDLSSAAKFMGHEVGSGLVSLVDEPAAGPTSGFYYFDDEGNLAQKTKLIEGGVLKGLISDELSAKELNINCSGNGRRVDYTRPVFSRMSCTYFDQGPHKAKELLSSLEKGLYLVGNSSGQEDPLGWGMQVNAPLAYEVKKGKLTGRVFGPVVLTGYVPDILKSISGVAADLAFRGLGKCGKTFWKDWVNVGMGSPTIRFRGRLA